MKTNVIRTTVAAGMIAAVSLLSSCGAATKAAEVPASAATTTTTAAPSTTAAPATTAAPKTTTAAKTTTTAATTTAPVTTTVETTMSEEEILKYQSDRYTEIYKGDKLTEIKAMMVNQGIAPESDIEMYTDEGESLDNFYNAPSTYDITRIVFKKGGTIQLYGVKNRLIPDAAKNAIKDSVISKLADKITDHFHFFGDD
jgi:predicted transglutaminase-like cysteine proteinase